jgi:hypothetical protein
MENMENIWADKANSLPMFVLAADIPMKALPLLLIPSVALLVSACAPAGPTYVSGGGGYYEGGGDGSGYYGPGGVWIVERGNDRDHDQNYYHHNVTNVNDVNINRTVENDRTVNRTNVNQTSISRRNGHTASKTEARKGNGKPSEKGRDDQRGNSQD